MELTTGTGIAATIGGVVGGIVVVVGLGLACFSWAKMQNEKANTERVRSTLKTLTAEGSEAAGPVWIEAILKAILGLAKTATGYALALMLIGTLLIVGSAWGTGSSSAAAPEPTAAPAETPTATQPCCQPCTVCSPTP